MPVPVPFGTLNSQLNSVWSSGQGSSSKVPKPFLVAINGHNYLQDLEFKPWKRQAFRATTTPITRTQADTSNEPGEQSLSTDSLWRRTQDSWHLGAGQVYLDRKNSQEYSFRQSKGVDPWTTWQLTLLNDTSSVLASANSNLQMVVCNAHVYLLDGQALKFAAVGNLSSWTTVTGTPADTASSICTDGHSVYVAYGAGGLYVTTEGAGSATQLVTSALGGSAIVRFVLGRLMVGDGGNLYNIISASPAALPSALLQSAYSNIVWTDMTGGNGVIFVCGNSGNFGLVYSIQITSDGTTLAAPIVCGQLPIGETINTIYGYAGSGVALGTSLGWRFSEQQLANGVAGTVALSIGPLFPQNAVFAFAGWQRFIFGTYGNYDTESTGLFRMDPSQFVADLAPAYASDLMATAQGTVQSIAITDAGVILFSVMGVGVFAQTDTFVPSGTIDSGLITYGLADRKMPVFVDITTDNIAGSHSVSTSVAYDGGSFQNIGMSSSTPVIYTELSTPQSLASSIEIRETLNADSNFMGTPTLFRHTLRSVPAPAAPTDWTIVIQLRQRFVINGVEVPMTPSSELAYLNELLQNKTINNVQIGNIGPYNMTIESIDWIPEQVGMGGEMNGVAVLTARTVV